MEDAKWSLLFVHAQEESFRADTEIEGFAVLDTLDFKGENVSAPLDTFFLLAQGPKNKIEDVDKAQAARELLTNILFFAEDPQSVIPVFQSACDFVSRVPVKRLTFVPDEKVWEMIG